MPANTADLQAASLREESGALPPPSALFGSSRFYSTAAPSTTATAVPASATAGYCTEPTESPSPRPVFILPPPSSLPGYHLPPPHASIPYIFPPTPSPPNLSMSSRSSDAMSEAPVNNNVSGAGTGTGAGAATGAGAGTGTNGAGGASAVGGGHSYGMYYYPHQPYPMSALPQTQNSTINNIHHGDDSSNSSRLDEPPVNTATNAPNKRKRRGAVEKKKPGRQSAHQSPPSTPPNNYHYEVIELHQHEAVSAAAATLASFATASPYDTTPPSTPPYFIVPDEEEDECDDLEEAACVGLGSLECTHCGVSFRHTNCLQRHRLEHDDSWKELQGRSLSKQQQAQLLEAAQILMDIARYGMRVRVVN
ncbi:C2H2-type zinc finger transcription factor [Phycomyces blakesleeanus]|uniref:C2H2-type zinc finger transcription factor n=2 Tax=Phycomyces blakesleeanus TaxID=4837 RepID=A0A162NM06_PHYB8|nr:C2H2-type zinc finger transcription factor [Phycomyces blakesleeanus NRRL 1555(-)]OAD75448.1 C2H2-type zinc finger transcription factor [Phycomyces blakesleeanus NRRL 1555(-)]|eukprot:XP_018293488.1 C2H2-type zinc finger transcription factor [Phycomyces blakesleeanus NRRL 1555(-)]